MASVTELRSYLVILFFGDFVSAMECDFDTTNLHALRSTGLRRVSESFGFRCVPPVEGCVVCVMLRVRVNGEAMVNLIS